MDKTTTEYQHWLEKNYVKGTAARRMSVLRSLDRKWPGTPLQKVTTDQIERWLDTSAVCPRTKKFYLSDMRCFYGWAQRKQGWKVDPTFPLDKIKVPALKPRPVTDAELRLSLRHADSRLRFIICLMAYAGLRACEVAGLDRGDIYEEEAIIDVRHGKGDKTRTVPLHPQIRWCFVQPGVPVRGPLFANRFGNALEANYIGRLVSAHHLELGIDGGGHRYRHWFGTNLAELCNGNLSMVGTLMGHSDPKTTKMYVDFKNGAAAPYVMALNPDKPPPDEGPTPLRIVS